VGGCQWHAHRALVATPLEKRPGMEALMAALLSNGVRTVLIEKLDRLARDTIISETAVAYFQRNDFELISTLEPDLCSDEPTRVLFRTMLAAFSQYEKSMIVLKLKGARARAKVKDPNWTQGRKPFGFREGEQDTIKRVMEMHAQGLKLPAITRQLNAEGHKTRTGKQFFPQQVADIITRAKKTS
jgi:DNA invertase Pin-like site-specific DNA recombinase